MIDGFLVLVGLLLACGSCYSASILYLTIVVIVAVVALEVTGKSGEKNLKGEVVVITGAGSGIGRLMALILAKLGCKLALWDINEEAVKGVSEEVRKAGAEAKIYVADVSDPKRVAELGASVIKDFGRVGEWATDPHKLLHA